MSKQFGIGINCPVMYEVLLLESTPATKEADIEFQKILSDRYEGHNTVSFEDRYAAIEFASTKLQEEDSKYKSSVVILELYNNYDDWQLVDAIPIWDAQVVDHVYNKYVN